MTNLTGLYRQYRSNEAARLRLVFVSTVGYTLLQQSVRDFHARLPQVTFEPRTVALPARHALAQEAATPALYVGVAPRAQFSAC